MLLYLIFVLINTLLVMRELSEIFGIGSIVETYVGGDTRIVSFIITFIVVTILTYPLYNKGRVITNTIVKGRTKNERLQEMYKLVAITITAILISTVLYFIVSRVYIVEPMLIIMNLSVIIVAYVYINKSYIGTILGEFVKGLEKKSTTVKYYLDTSALIDGRVLNLGKVLGNMVVIPEVIEELHKMSDDSTDLIKRKKGQKGLEVLAELKKGKGYDLTLEEGLNYSTKGVDDNLIEILEREDGVIRVVTTDYALSKKIEGKGLEVINLNELTNDLKIGIDIGETLELVVIKKGKKNNQGIANLDDGTLVVIDDAINLIGEKVKVEVYNIISKESGTIVFSKCIT